MNSNNLIPAKAKEGGWICENCKSVFRVRKDLQAHRRSTSCCKKYSSYKKSCYEQRVLSNKKECLCKFCGKKSTTKSGNTLHEKYCEMNPEKSICIGHKVSDETKKKLSANANRDPKKGAGRGIKGYYKGLYCMSTWELAWVVYQLEHGKKVEQCKERFPYNMNGELHYYTPDFKIGDTYYEIKNWHRPDTDFKISQFPKDKTLVLIEGKRQNEVFISYVVNKYGKEFYKTLYEC